MEIVVKLLIGFVVFFVGVVLNVTIMKKFEGRQAEGFLPMLSFILICAGLVMLVVMASSVQVDISGGVQGSPPPVVGYGSWR